MRWLGVAMAALTFAACSETADVQQLAEEQVTGEAISPEACLETPLTLEAMQDGTTVTFNNPLGLAIEYRVIDADAPNRMTHSGEGWTTCTATISRTLTAEQCIQFRGNNPTYYSEDEGRGNVIACSDDCYMYGNIMSLIDAENYSTNKVLSADNTFNSLFVLNDCVKNHPSKELILPATTLAEGCYNSMFEGCSGLTSAPALPATTLAEGCYVEMFSHCTHLTSAPALPATTLAEGCYDSMFMGCEGLTSAPALPAATLTESCYFMMFYGCTSLAAVTC